ncbi:ATP-binding cassette domain-containing protein [uncultured Ferrovibrio sp.]|jgi:putative ABC transport system ATP-binding protein|uniref:ABC transporter ATP-binding protein n=1 Tax=uncultured Ferrovibrio sp. TaxID=1576913 RepID=UPI0026126DD1|nr:ATP-binding cassette domain-containing protein [uncultured Ferrovibrio sp.]
MTSSKAEPPVVDLTPIVELAEVKLTLTSTAGPVNILRGIDLTVRQGEHVGIVGPSGSGKSTLLAVIAGLEKVTSGQVRVAGADLNMMNEDKLALWRRDKLGIVFQSFHLIPTMTALENVAVPLELAGAPDAMERARAALHQVGLGHRETHYPAQLSGGEQQRVALARAVAPRPALLLADEPTGNLDGTTGHAIIDLMFGEATRLKSTLILITHDDKLAALCDRVVHIEDGRVKSVIAKSGAAMPLRHAGSE